MNRHNSFTELLEPQSLLSGRDEASAPVPGTNTFYEFNDTVTSAILALSGAVEAEQRAVQAQVAFPACQTRAPQTIALALKRAVDFIGALIIALLIAPVLALCAAVVYFTSPGPVLFRHKRLGRAGKEFGVWKFRTMCMDPERILFSHLEKNPEARLEWNRSQKLTNDPRVTAVGRILRRFSLDELPQLWNVMKGEMSLIGPRPIVRVEVEKYGEAISAYYAVRPGMTGLWQVSGRSDTTYSQRVQLDRQYAEQWSPSLDLSIFLKTFRVLVTGSGAY